MKKFIQLLEHFTTLIISGIFLILGLFFNETFTKLVPFSPFWVTLILSGFPIFYQAMEALIKEKGIAKLTSNLLVIMGTFASITLGDLLAGAEIVFIMALGTWLEEKTIARAKQGLYQLIKNTPVTARKLIGQEEQIISVEDVKQGDVLRVLPGELLAVDGTVLQGQSAIDQAVLTGESLPVDKSVGDGVFGGTQNLYGTLDFVATKEGKDGTLQRLIRLVEEAEKQQAPIQKTADKFANFMVPLSLTIALLTYLFTGELERAVSVMVVFCPCALVLATPTAIMAAIGQATKRGIIIKSGQILENMSKIDTIAFDKTGTLTKAKLQVAQVYLAIEHLDRTEILSYLASAEQKSEHPLAKTIVAYAKEQGLTLLPTSHFQMFAGRGILADFNTPQIQNNQTRRIFAGNQKFLEENGFDLKNLLLSIETQGHALVFVGEAWISTQEHSQSQDQTQEATLSNQQLLACVALSDTIKEEATPILQTLREMNIDLCLLTGDNLKTAEHFAQKFNIQDIQADLLPEQKAACIREKQAQNHIIAMIGDGVNDALALKNANVGISMGALGSDLAIESSDIVLLKDDLEQLPYLKKLSKACKQTITFSLSLAMGINLVALALSIAGLLNPTGGALVHNLGSVFVIMLAALLYDRKL